MANSKKPANKRDSILIQVQQVLAEVFAAQKLANPQLLVAFSGGLDSTVLLHILSKLRADLPIQLSAMHVHHGLSVNADGWAHFCEQTCANLNIPFQLKKIQIDKKSGLGIESTARNARYQALSEPQADFICLAQHQNDQAETLLLQLARGAGVKGLAGMSQMDLQRKLLRPLLNISRANLEAYAKQYRLQWVEDESNDDTQFDRNFMRHDVLPVLQKRYHAISQTLTRSAENLAEAGALLDELAKMDAGNADQPQKINLALFKYLSTARQANLMRWWLAQNQIGMPSAQQLQQILQQILHAKSDAVVKIKVAESQYLRRYQGSAYLVSACTKVLPINLLWQGEEAIVLPDQSSLIFTKKMGEGLALARDGLLQANTKLRIKNRDGGERFKPALGRPSRTLKYVLQSIEMPPWQREQLPLIFMDETLVYIPNLGAATDFQAAPNEMGCVITWAGSEP